MADTTTLPDLTAELNSLAFDATADIAALIAVGRRVADLLGGQEGESHVALISCLKQMRRLNSVVMSLLSG